MKTLAATFAVAIAAFPLSSPAFASSALSCAERVETELRELETKRTFLRDQYLRVTKRDWDTNNYPRLPYMASVAGRTVGLYASSSVCIAGILLLPIGGLVTCGTISALGLTGGWVVDNARSQEMELAQRDALDQMRRELSPAALVRALELSDAITEADTKLKSHLPALAFYQPGISLYSLGETMRAEARRRTAQGQRVDMAFYAFDEFMSLYAMMPAEVTRNTVITYADYEAALKKVMPTPLRSWLFGADTSRCDGELPNAGRMIDLILQEKGVIELR
jgi:hypothetical protein